MDVESQKSSKLRFVQLRNSNDASQKFAFPVLD